MIDILTFWKTKNMLCVVILTRHQKAGPTGGLQEKLEKLLSVVWPKHNCITLAVDSKILSFSDALFCQKKQATKATGINRCCKKQNKKKIY